MWDSVAAPERRGEAFALAGTAEAARRPRRPRRTRWLWRAQRPRQPGSFFEGSWLRHFSMGAPTYDPHAMKEPLTSPSSNVEEPVQGAMAIVTRARLEAGLADQL